MPANYNTRASGEQAGSLQPDTGPRRCVATGPATTFRSLETIPIPVVSGVGDEGAIPMLRPTMLLWLPLALTLGCGGAGSNDGGAGSNDGGAGNESADELAGIIAEIEDLYDRARPFLEQQAAELAAAEEAYNNAPWGRSSARPTAEDVEKRRLRDERDQLRIRYRNPQRTLENNLSTLEELRTAYEDDTWDLLTMGMVSPRSFLIDDRRTAERQLIRLEAGCGAEAPIPSNDDCEVE